MKLKAKRHPLKADLHVHSRYSHRPSSWILKKLGCSESYTDPAFLYRTLKRRGMDVITITDHNTISGCLEIIHLKDTFISEEVTAYFPEDNCKLHVLVYDITPAQHDDIAKIRKNVYDLVPYLNAENIVHAIAHPMFSINGLLRDHHFEKILLLFNIIELNGARDARQNNIIQQILKGLTKENIDRLAEIHDMAPVGDAPWEKHVISGSDDHSSLYMGYSYTQGLSATSFQGLLADIACGNTTVKTHNSSPETLAHNVYSIMYQFYNQQKGLSKWLKDPVLCGFFNNSLLRPYRLKTPPEKKITPRPFRGKGYSSHSGFLPDDFLKNAKQILFSDPRLNACLDNGHRRQVEKPDDVWGNFVRKASEAMTREFAEDILGRLNKGQLLSILTSLSSSVSIYMLLSPYFIAYSLFSRDRAFSISCLEKYADKAVKSGQPSKYIGMFTDTYTEINGVASAIQSQVKAAELTGKPLKLIVSHKERLQDTNVMCFEPIEEFDVPEYPELKVYLPKFLEILAYCYNEQFTHIQAETPGAMGLVAIGVSKLLNLPFTGTYHTSLPQTVKALTKDANIEAWFWKYIVWFYGQMEKVYVPSAATAQELIDKGLPKDKLIVHQWGVDTTYFHPSKRNGFFSGCYNVGDQEIKLLYVGRVSQEKNLAIFEKMMQKITEVRDDVRLIIVGEGPYLAEMKSLLNDHNTIFTGYLTGEQLAQAYASSDIFVFPSMVDTMGNVVVEAQASGLPVLVTDKGGPAENMIDDHTGRVIHADDDLADHFADAVLQLCGNPQQLKTMRKNAREYTSERSFENSFLEYWNAY